MKVLIVTPWYPSRAGQSGGLFIKDQARALVEAGCRVVVVSPRPHWLPVPGKRGIYWRENVGPAHQVIDGVDVYLPRYLMLPRRIGWSRVGGSCFRSMRRLIQGLNRKHEFDIIHGHQVLPVGLSAPYVKALTQLPFILTVHGPNPAVSRFMGVNQPGEPIFAGHPNPAVSRFLGQTGNGRLKQNMWDAIDRVAAVGTPVLGWLKDLECKSSRISIIPNGAETVDPSISLPEGYKERFGPFRVILSVSNLFPNKGVDTNLHALKKLKDSGYDDVHYIVIGEGYEQKNFMRLTAELGLERNVTFLGRLPRADTLAYMNACDVFSLPSRQEAFGIVYVEAMGFNKPVIGCWGQGAEDIITPELDGLLVDPQNADDLALAFRRILGDPAFGARLAEAASIRAAEFSWERNALSYIRLYKSTLAGHSVSPRVTENGLVGVSENCA
jgi:teichuronic acid biosynthesis glycosyltransferase TuaC